MTQAQPLVSVLMPIYNHGAFVAVAVASVLGQTHRHLELIAWDDGSTDDSWDRLVQTAGDDPRVRLRRHDDGCNLGVNATLRACLAEATGTYIAILASDDAFLPTRLADGVATLESTDAVACHARVRVIDVVDQALNPTWGAPYRAPGDTFQQMLVRNVAMVPTLLVRRTALIDVGGFAGEPRFEDAYLMLRLSAVGRVIALPQVLASYRITPGGIYSTSTRSSSHLRNYLEALLMLMETPWLAAERRSQLELAIAAWQDLCDLAELQRVPRPQSWRQAALVGILIDAWWGELRPSLDGRALARLVLTPGPVGRPARRRVRDLARRRLVPRAAG